MTMSPRMSAWPEEVAFWLQRRGLTCTVKRHESYTTEHDTELQCGALCIDGVEYSFDSVAEKYGFAQVVFEGIPGECNSPDQQCYMRLPDGLEVSERHPGLQWKYHGNSIDADEMRRLWRASEAFPWEMPCFYNGEKVEFQDCGTNDVETDTVLEFLCSHLKKCD